MRPVSRLRRAWDAIARDDQLLDRLGRDEDTGTDDLLAHSFAEWRRDLCAEPVRERRVAAFRSGGGRVGRSVAAGAIASAIGLASVGGVAAAATQAGPGSALFPITRVVAADRAESRQAAQRARLALDEAAAAADADERDQAAAHLEAAEQVAGRVRRDDGAGELRDRAAELRRRLAAPAATPTASPSASPSASPGASPGASATPSPRPSRSASPTGSPAPTPGASGSGGSPSSPYPSPSPSATGGSPTASPHRSPQPRPTRSAPQRTAEPSASPSGKSSPGLAERGAGLLGLLLPGGVE
jgi:hypothetical protein